MPLKREEEGFMRIVLLMGPSSAGKTTLCAELKASHQWLVISGDDVSDRIFAGINARVKPELFARLQEEKHLVTELRKYMNDDQLYQFSMRGTLTITKDGHDYVHQFQNPTLPNLLKVLENAKLDENEIKRIAPLLITSTAKGKITGDDFHKRHPNIMPNLEKEIFDEAFSHNDSKKNIVIDTIPNEGGRTHKLLEDFHNRANQFRERNGEKSLETFTVLAYCPPQKLSERVARRNLEADRDKNPKNKRVGLFPFHQLGEVVRAEDQSKHSQFTFGTVSRDELFKISSDHLRPTKMDAKDKSLFLENPVDPNALHVKGGEKENRPKLKVTDNNTVKLDLSDDDSMEPSNIQRPRIGTKETVMEYGLLAKKFGFLKDDQEQVRLSSVAGLGFDAVINMAQGDAKALANELLSKVEHRSDRRLDL